LVSAGRGGGGGAVTLVGANPVPTTGPTGLSSNVFGSFVSTSITRAHVGIVYNNSGRRCITVTFGQEGDLAGLTPDWGPAPSRAKRDRDPWMEQRRGSKMAASWQMGGTLGEKICLSARGFCRFSAVSTRFQRTNGGIWVELMNTGPESSRGQCSCITRP